MIIRIITLLLVLSTFACKSNSQQKQEGVTETIKEIIVEFPSTVELIEKSEKDWKAELSKAEFYVLRQAGTERPHTGDLLKNKKKGVYTCAACDLPLFSSSSKFKSGTGWPSFYEPINEAYVTEDTDHKIGYARTEIRCARCDGHQGHVFNDGPEPTGLRYCINSVALNFVEDKVTTKIAK